MSDGLPFQAGKFLIIAGVALVVLGLLLMAGVRLSFLGRLPGDIAYRGRNVTFYFPVVTCLLVSVVLTIVFWLVSFLTKR
jgi:predicted Co/Zn/Cd cation transporter (cation efflux family)